MRRCFHHVSNTVFFDFCETDGGHQTLSHACDLKDSRCKRVDCGGELYTKISAACVPVILVFAAPKHDPFLAPANGRGSALIVDMCLVD